MGFYNTASTETISNVATYRLTVVGRCRFLAAANGGQILVERQMAIKVAEVWSKSQIPMMEAMESMYRSHSTYAGGDSSRGGHPPSTLPLRPSNSSALLLNEDPPAPSREVSSSNQTSLFSSGAGPTPARQETATRPGSSQGSRFPIMGTLDAAGAPIIDFRHSVDMGSVNRPNRLKRVSSANDPPMDTLPDNPSPGKLGKLQEQDEEADFSRWDDSHAGNQLGTAFFQLIDDRSDLHSLQC